MTQRELNRLFHDHINRDFELATDQLLQRAVIAGFARRSGRSFHYLYATGATS